MECRFRFWIPSYSENGVLQEPPLLDKIRAINGRKWKINSAGGLFMGTNPDVTAEIPTKSTENAAFQITAAPEFALPFTCHIN